MYTWLCKAYNQTRYTIVTVKRLMERRVAVFKIARNVTINVTRSILLKINLYQINLRTFLESDVKEVHQCQIFTDQQKVRRLAEVLKK